MNDRARTLKIVLMGPGSVGKTSIRKRYLGLGFDTSHYMTIGADFAVKTWKNNGQEYRIQIWDLSGQPLFYEVRRLYYQHAHGLFLVFDLSNLSSLERIPSWLDEYFKNTRISTTPAILIGNKSDLIEDIEEMRTSIHGRIEDLDLTKRIDSDVILTSALTGRNIDLAFDVLVNAIVDND